ncbi:MAG: guanylate kinase [Bacteroidales bacterium]|jgi:guanylate kinase|nr:guanylate kinase [Bacteroidales bacterium]
METQKRKVFIFSAPSGSGKTTIVRAILDAEFPFSFSISATSRPKRKTETEGKDYYFVSPEEFIHKIDNDEFIEWEEVYENVFYGTLKGEIERIFQIGKYPIFDVDVVGGLNLKKYFGDNALAVFVQAPSIEILEERLRSRSTDDEESIQKRLAKYNYEMNFASKFDIIVVNDQLDRAIEETKKHIQDFIEK